MTLVPAGQAFALTEPEITPEATPLLTSPVYCNAEPANINRIIEIAGSAIEDENATVPEEFIPLDEAEIATGDAAGAVIDLVNTFVACANADDELRALSLLSDDFIKRSAYDILGGETPPDLSDGSAPLDVEDQTRIAAMTDVYRLPDERYSVIFDLGPVSGETPFARVQFVIIDNDGEYQIDDYRFQDLEFDQPDCGSSEADGCLPPEEATPVTGDGYSGWIMTADQANEATLYFGLDDATYNGFEVTPEQITEAEAALPAFLANQPRATPRLIDEVNTGTYERQYLGYASEDQRLIVINGYCPDAYMSPSQYPVLVMDGGDCFWQATYSLTDKRFIRLSVNGDA
jgi:hypothetical protein